MLETVTTDEEVPATRLKEEMGNRGATTFPKSEHQSSFSSSSMIVHSVDDVLGNFS